MWKMEYIGPSVIIPVKYGTVKAIFTNGGHVWLTADTDRGTDYRAGGHITYRDRQYRLNVHLYAASGWSEEPCDDRISSYRDQFAPRTYRAAMTEEFTRAVSEYVREHPAILADAQRNYLQHEIERATAERDENHRKYMDAYRTVADLENALARLNRKGVT
jgi:hypothetical protein